MSDKTFSGAELVVETLNAYNVPHIFDIPGAEVDAVFDAVCDNVPEIILCHQLRWITR
ncbi:AlsS [Photobacterium sp. SKA34]|uniref:AlsS n=1 Tax=Photobacterium sp. SKA34 TaxID=121723 RepID=UPI00006B41FC|nr:AlsS [Photobacterium sp. SKA34]EAR56701.1 AlsS [Photobacterium sp. SKA34]